MLQLLALIMGGAAHLAMQAKALLVDAAHGGRWRLCREGLQAQHFLTRPRPERNAVGAGCLLQGRQGGLRTAVGQGGHPLLFDEEALMSARVRRCHAKTPGGTVGPRDGHPSWQALVPVRPEASVAANGWFNWTMRSNVGRSPFRFLPRCRASKRCG